MSTSASMAGSSLSPVQSAMLKKYSLSTDQALIADHILEGDATLLVAPKGMGKTRIGLTVAGESLGRTIILAPNKVRQGWVDEAERLGMTVAIVDGTAKVRRAIIENLGLDIVVMGADLAPWLATTYCPRIERYFAGMIVDETTRYGAPGSAGVKALRRVRKGLEWALGLTASPVIENPLKLYGQALIIDGGVALGTRYEKFKRKYFYPTDWENRNWELLPGAAERLAEAVKDLVYVPQSGAQYEDALPDVITRLYKVAMSDRQADLYEQAANKVIEDEVLKTLDLANAAVVTGKLQQLSQGFIYTADGQAIWVNFAKAEKAVSLAKKIGEPVVIVYNYETERTVLRKYFPDSVDLMDAGAKDAFCGGEADVLTMNARSGSHGIDGLQYVCRHMIFMAPLWSADLWDQSIGRIRRRGQKHVCTRHVLLSDRLLDPIILDRAQGKTDTGGALMEHLKAFSQRSTGYRWPGCQAAIGRVVWH